MKIVHLPSSFNICLFSSIQLFFRFQSPKTTPQYLLVGDQPFFFIPSLHPPPLSHSPSYVTTPEFPFVEASNCLKIWFCNEQSRFCHSPMASSFFFWSVWGRWRMSIPPSWSTVALIFCSEMRRERRWGRVEMGMPRS